jgi:hypothetical protein
MSFWDLFKKKKDLPKNDKPISPTELEPETKPEAEPVQKVNRVNTFITL